VIVEKASCLRAVLRPGSPRSEEWKNDATKSNAHEREKVAMSQVYRMAESATRKAESRRNTRP
jgi:hypothetical protein